MSRQQNCVSKVKFLSQVHCTELDLMFLMAFTRGVPVSIPRGNMFHLCSRTMATMAYFELLPMSMKVMRLRIAVLCVII